MEAKLTITVGAMLLRAPKLDISRELEATKLVKPKRVDHWEWEGFVNAI